MFNIFEQFLAGGGGALSPGLRESTHFKSLKTPEICNTLELNLN